MFGKLANLKYCAGAE